MVSPEALDRKLLSTVSGRLTLARSGGVRTPNFSIWLTHKPGTPHTRRSRVQLVKPHPCSSFVTPATAVNRHNFVSGNGSRPDEPRRRHGAPPATPAGTHALGWGSRDTM